MPTLEQLRQFHQFADPFPEAILLVDAEGVILTINQSAKPQLAAYSIHFGKTSLLDVCSDSPDQVKRYLHNAKRTRSFVPGRLTFMPHDGEASVFRTECALYATYEGENLPQLLLRLVPKQIAEGRFVLLNQQIQKLSGEVDRRRQAELRLINEHRRKDEFLAMLGHELRNPLAPIKSALQLQAMPNCSETIRKGAGEILHRQVDHLAHLVNELLDVARISTGKISLTQETLDAKSIVYRAIELCKPLIQSKDHQLSVELAQEPLYVQGDLHRLTVTIQPQ